MFNKKGMGIGDLYPAVLALVLVGIVLGIGLTVLNSFLGQLNSTTAAYTAVNNTIIGIATFPTWISIIVTVIAAAIILGLVLHSLAGGSGRA